uniref:Uncharacterized protein n=1 Tax=Pyrodinium bahamense TaxID=73915 RepID=A0A7S0B415_9DINO
MHLMAGEVLRLEEYARGIPLRSSSGSTEGGDRGAVQALFPRAFFLGGTSRAAAARDTAGDSDSAAPARALADLGGPEALGEEVLQQWTALLGIAQQLEEQWDVPMRRVSADRRIFWRCVAPRDSEGPLWTREISEAPGEAWRYWKCPRGKLCTA